MSDTQIARLKEKVSEQGKAICFLIDALDDILTTIPNTDLKAMQAKNAVQRAREIVKKP